ncbi:Sensor-type histidine kinase PrrB [Streptomyces lavendulae subsp. lavendulae]|uniref:histidine kinase n=1 Tax=Streptomyces lavendulae subsp. lavendulae TaxID=58340 RepID=A0A2K8PQG8_STRLA|nr:HAMP domain-containing sensor histidine kinase [Streptomyces lavendulae]ATZ29006.1 Sensor-type histidine kinase PrrB [Streptomyces lavendulae subsp. lavendulae]QUQ58827.1 Sensor-type histidine kinase PrrB [Streptomyces lavendulae subsp. lavendulae]
MKLSTRIALSVTVVMPLLVLAAGLLVLGLVSRDLRQQQDARLQDRASAVLPDVRALLAADRNGRPKAEQNQHRKVLGDVLDAGIRVRGANGATVLEGGPQPDAAVRLPDRTPQGPVTVRAKGHAWRVLSVPVTGGAAGNLWIYTAASSTDPQVAAVRRRVLLVALLAAPVSGLLAYGLAGRATASVRRLSRRAAGLDPAAGAAAFAGTPANIAEVDELSAAIGQLLTRYDEQAARTAQALETARSFSSAASHELRTPLMSMQTDLDVLAAHPDLSPGERAEVVSDLRSDHARLLELLGALRMLALGDLVEVSAFAPLDLCELVDAAATEAARRDGGAGLVLDVDLPAELRIFGWDSGLKIMLANLLRNAVVHGHLPGEPPRVTVRLRAQGGFALLTVDDEGPGVPPAEREAVFGRFHRRPGSPGSGLGLTLVAQQAALHRGTVTLGEVPGGTGARIEVRLPLVSEDEPTVRLPARRDWISRGD